MKRTHTAKLLLMGLVPIALAACGGSPSPTAEASDKSATQDACFGNYGPLRLPCTDSAASDVQKHTFESVPECVSAGMPQDQCQKAEDEAMATSESAAPKYKTREACVEDYGAEMCQPRHDAQGNDFFGPLAAGFMLSQMMSGGRTVYVQSQPVYRTRPGHDYRPYTSSYRSGSYTNPDSSYGTSRTAAPSSYSRSSSEGSATGSRAITASRGGFGSSSAMRGSFGG